MRTTLTKKNVALKNLYEAVENETKIKNVSINNFRSVSRSFIKKTPLGLIKALLNQAYITVEQNIRHGNGIFKTSSTRMVYLLNDTRRNCSWMLVTPMYDWWDKDIIEFAYANEDNATLYKLPFMKKKDILEAHGEKLNNIMKKYNIK